MYPDSSARRQTPARGQRNTEVISRNGGREEKKKERGEHGEGKREEEKESRVKAGGFFSFCEKSKNKSGPRVDASHEATIYQKLIIH